VDQVVTVALRRRVRVVRESVRVAVSLPHQVAARIVVALTVAVEIGASGST